jgi:hypothetical protein
MEKKVKVKGGSVSIYIADLKLWNEYRKLCKKLNGSASSYLQAMIEEFMHRNKK